MLNHGKLNGKESMLLKNSLFHGLVKNEITFTELVCNLFKMYKPFRSLFLQFLSLEDDGFDIDSQFITSNGRPDIIIENSQQLIFIEIKVGDAELKDSQPNGYIAALEELKEGRSQQLFFIIPKQYKHIKELEERISHLSESDVVKILFWENFFILLTEKYSIFNGNLVLKEVYNLFKSWFGYEQVSFDQKELDLFKDIGKTIHKLGVFYENVAILIEKEGYSTKADTEYGTLGFWITNSDRELILWFGSWFQLWNKEGSGFVCLIGYNDMHREKSFKEFDKAFGKTKTYTNEDNSRWKYYSLDAKISPNKDNAQEIKDFLITKVKELE
jgi:hypothetical protein